MALLSVGGIEVVEDLRVPLLGIVRSLLLDQPLLQLHLLLVEAAEAVAQAEDKEEADTDERDAGHGGDRTDNRMFL